jgi:hypothetical protein
VNGVAPAPIWTPLQISGGASEWKVVTFGATAPLGGGQPSELVGIFVRLAEDDGSYTEASMVPVVVEASSPTQSNHYWRSMLHTQHDASHVDSQEVTEVTDVHLSDTRNLSRVSAC